MTQKESIYRLLPKRANALQLSTNTKRKDRDIAAIHKYSERVKYKLVYLRFDQPFKTVILF